MQLRVADRLLVSTSRQVRVAFTGAHSTGKSTLLARCKKEFGPRVYPIENIARSLIARGFKMGISANSAGLLSYLSAQLDAEHKIRGEAELVISDRTCIDSVAYCRANRSSVYAMEFHSTYSGPWRLWPCANHRFTTYMSTFLSSLRLHQIPPGPQQVNTGRWSTN